MSKNNRRTILVLSNSFSGLYRFRKELLLELLDRYEVVLAAPGNHHGAELAALGCRICDIAVARREISPCKDLMLFFRYLKLILRERPACVLTYTIKPNIYGGLAARLAGRPYLCNITGLGSAFQNRRATGLLTAVYRQALRKAACVFFQNKDSQAFLTAMRVVSGPWRLIPGSGVNTEHFSPQEYPEDQGINFLMVSRIIREKGIDQYLQAAESLTGKYRDLQFHLIGSDEEDYTAKIEALHQKGVIHYHGRQNDVRDFYRDVHCVVHPSYYNEGMSNVLLEAAACGRPVIATDHPGCRETVNAGRSGLLCEPKNSESLITAIEQFLAIPWEARRDMGLAGRAKVEQEFDRRVVMGAYLEEIEKAVKG